MQQTKSYWRFLAAAGVVSALVASACVVTTTSDGGGGAGGAAGAGTAGAVATAGAATAGAPSAGASGASTAGAAGMAAVPFQCDVASGAIGTPNTCVPPVGSENDCNTCIQSKCCAEFSACYATGPGNQCGWGGPLNGGEYTCAQDCIVDKVQKGGVADDTTIGTCANSCATTTANMASKECNLVGVETQDLLGCISVNCGGGCFGM